MKYSKIKLAEEALKHKGFISKIPHVFRMVNAFRKGTYKTKIGGLLLPALALVYIISPLDVLPDWIPGIGALDDIGILALALPLLMKEVDKFLLWEAQQKDKDLHTIDVDAQ